MIRNCQLVRLIRVEGDDIGHPETTESHPLSRDDELRGVQCPASESRLMNRLKARRNLHYQRPDIVLRQHRTRGHCARQRTLVAKGTCIAPERICVSVPTSTVQVLRRWREILGQQRLRSGMVIVN